MMMAVFYRVLCRRIYSFNCHRKIKYANRFLYCIHAKYYLLFLSSVCYLPPPTTTPHPIVLLCHRIFFLLGMCSPIGFVWSLHKCWKFTWKCDRCWSQYSILLIKCVGRHVTSHQPNNHRLWLYIFYYFDGNHVYMILTLNKWRSTHLNITTRQVDRNHR